MTLESWMQLEKIRKISALVLAVLCVLNFIFALFALVKTGLWGLAWLLISFVTVLPGCLALVSLFHFATQWIGYRGEIADCSRAETVAYAISFLVNAVSVGTGILLITGHASESGAEWIWQFTALFLTVCIKTFCEVIGHRRNLEKNGGSEQ